MEHLTHILSDEHEVVLQKLERFEAAIDRFAVDEMREILRFFDERLVLHRRKEEEVLFPEIARHFPPGVGPVACMIEEHRTEKEHLEALRRALDLGDAGAVADHGRAILSHLRGHIWKEENVLFPMAEQLLKGDVRTRVLKGFEAIGACCSDCDHRAAKSKSSS